MSERTENDAVIEIAKEAARAESQGVPVQPGEMYVFPTPDGIELLDLANGLYSDRLPAPRRKAGLTTVTDVDSFIAYWNKHHDADSEVYVNVSALTITAILDAHTAAGARWREHHLVLKLATTKSWRDWTGMDRRNFEQEAFANFVEDHLTEIVEPNAATMLEIAQTFQAKTKVEFSSATILSSGNRRLSYAETTDATAGAKGNLDVPSTFKIVVKPLELPVAEGEDPLAYGLDARFRYRIEKSKLYVQYLLDDPDAVLRDAVLSVAGQIEDRLDVTIMRGAPA